MKQRPLDKNDHELLEFIRSTYRAVYFRPKPGETPAPKTEAKDADADLPAMLKTTPDPFKFLFIHIAAFDKTKATNPPTPLSFEKDYWIPKLNMDIELRNSLITVISKICDYQTHHINKTAFRNHVSDASMLVLELIKEKCIAFKGGITDIDVLCKRDSDLERLINFIERLEASKRFHQSNDPSNRMELFCNIRLDLEELLSNLRLYMQNTHSRDDLKIVIDRGDDLLRVSIDCLHYMLRNQPTLQDSAISSLRNPQNLIQVKQMNCYLGQLLRVLLTSPVFTFLYGNGNNYNTSLIIHMDKTDPIFISDEDEWGKRPDINHWFNTFKTEKRSELTGAEAACLTEDVIKKFIMLHGLIEQLGWCLLACKKAHACSGDGGDILVYGLLNGPVADLMENTVTIINQISTSFMSIRKSLDQIYKKFVISNKVKEVEPWFDNYNKAKVQMRHFDGLTQSCITSLGNVYAKAKRGIDEEMLEKIVNNIRGFVLLTDSINKRLGKESCIERLPDRIKKLLNIDATPIEQRELKAPDPKLLESPVKAGIAEIKSDQSVKHGRLFSKGSKNKEETKKRDLDSKDKEEGLDPSKKVDSGNKKPDDDDIPVFEGDDFSQGNGAFL